MAALLFGLLPGTALRGILLLFPHDDPRRKELQAELYAVPWWERPLWVAEQLEVAIFEGLGARICGRLDSVARLAIRRTFRSQAIRNDLLEVIEEVPIGARFYWAIRECLSAARTSWTLQSGVEMNRMYPESFEIPAQEDKAFLEPGDSVKLMFEASDDWGERMWVRVERRTRRGFVGRMNNTPIGFPRLGYGDGVRFTADDIIDVDFKEWIVDE